MKDNRDILMEYANFGTKKVKLYYDLDYRELLEKNKQIIITDENVYNIYKSKHWGLNTIIIGTGEKTKTIETINKVYARFLKLGIDRSYTVIGIGGGIVCDIAGFIASTYNRGLKLGLVPTTLLAQVDASIGGKTAYNLDRYKNIIGTFYQPEFIIFDSNFLKTLNKTQILCGLSETIKHALIGSMELFDFLCKNHKAIMQYDISVLKTLVYLSSKIKMQVVEKDEKESGLRRILNFGHTFGHAIERELDISHGEAVSAGMLISLRFSLLLNYLNKGTYDKIIKLFNLFDLYLSFDTNNNIIHSIAKDKKKQGDSINFVFLKDIGNAFVKNISIKELSDLYLTGTC